MAPAIESRQRILEAARGLIHARSYADVGVAAICEHAQVQKGSFYHFFPSKKDLTLAVLDAFYVEMKRDLVDQAFAPDCPPLQRLERMAELAYAFQKTIKDSSGHMLGCPFGNLAVELSTQDEAIREKIAGIFTRLRQAFRGALEEAVATGAVQDIDVDATAEAMLAYFEGVMLMAKTRNDAEVLRELLPAVAGIRIELPAP
jgi:TetR/AcrR family transcriptional repressor of nem operon